MKRHPRHLGLLASREGHIYSTRTGERVSTYMCGNYIGCWVDGKTRKVHRIVYESFHPDEDISDKVIRHLDNNTLNNAPENLASGTVQDNVDDRTRSGRFRNSNMYKTTCPRGHELCDVNIMPSQAKRGHRSCLACSRAHNVVANSRRKGFDVSGSFESIADSKYAEIMTGERS